jgi:EAL domain-containing protein (putative c-di-GMP-specific phosphodiesterase class I)
MGIDFVQGSLIHEPAPIDEIFMQPITSSVIDIPI